MPCDACGGDCVDETQAISAHNNHVTGDVVYQDPPPTSGDHNACWATWGTHATDPGDEHWVHNEEHGGVVFLYLPADCDAGDSGGNPCDSEVAGLDAILGTEGDSRWVITPYDQLTSAWAAVSWGHRDLYGCFDLPTMQAFFEAHVGQGAEDTTADPPATCPQ